MGHGAASDLPASADVAILGAGVMGCAIADALSGRGLSVVVLDPTGIGAAASSGAAGLLAPLVEAPGPGPFLTLALASLERFPALAEELREETGIDVGWRERATLRVAETEQEQDELRVRVAWQRAQGLPAEWLDAAALKKAEPLLRDGLMGALRSGRDGVVTSGRLTAALAARARIRGASFVVAGTQIRATRSADRVDRMDVDGGSLVAGEVVLAAGPWSAGVARALGVGPLPVRPVKGQLALAGRQRAPAHSVFATGGYVAGKADDVLVTGATVEDRGFDSVVDAAAHESLVARAVYLVPSLDPSAFTLRWAGLRPDLPDHLPALGRTERARNVLVATGHFRNGILLAPISAEAIAAAATGERFGLDLGPFSPDRFASDEPGVSRPPA